MDVDPEWVAVALTILSGVGWFGWYARQRYQQRNALAFSNELHRVEESVWSGGKHSTRIKYCVRVTNKSDDPVQARVVIEDIDGQRQPERPLQVFAAPEGHFLATVSPGNSATALFELVETHETTDMQWLCFAQSVHESYPRTTRAYSIAVRRWTFRNEEDLRRKNPCCTRP
jgi:hypothetical protein